jgi:hypothetical protein
MPHLNELLHRVSVGRINLGRFGVYSYFGTEDNIIHDGQNVYGGTSIGLFANSYAGRSLVVRKLEIPEHLVNAGLAAIEHYHQIASTIGRVSVDVIEGITDNGSRLTSVVDITPRVGGVTPAEILAIGEVGDNRESICFSTSQLIYNPEYIPKTGKNFIETNTLIINARIDEVVL